MKKSLLKRLTIRSGPQQGKAKSLVLLTLMAVMTWSAQVSAAGVGGINVTSALGQPLKADIELVAVSKSEKSSLVARLASPEAYKVAGLDYPYGNKFKFTIESRADGASYISATSAQPINDPFVSLLVELSWSSGKLVREFTFLLDPVGYQAEQPVAPPVQTIAPVVEPVVPAVVAPVEPAVQPAVQPVATQPPVETPVLETIPIEPEEAKSGEVEPAKEQLEKAAGKKPVPDKVSANGEISVQRGDTLSKIAAANKVDGVSLERMLVAMYRANANQFDGKNMNRIKTGKILRMPDAKDLETLTQADAKKEIHAQVSDWNAYRQKLASAAPASVQQQAAQQVSAGKISSSVADKTPVAKETAKEVLKLSKGEVTTDKSVGKATSQDKKNAAQEEAIAKAKAAEEERTRTALLEKNLQNMKHLAELKTQAAALAQAASAPVAASQVAAASQASAASVVQDASAVAATSAVQPVAKPKPAPSPVVVETSMLDQVLQEPLYLGGGAAAILGLGGLAFFMRRRKNKQADAGNSSDEDIGSITGNIASPEVSSPETGDFTTHAGDTLSLNSTSSSDDDPISEADLFLSFGRDAQAEEILKEALQTSANKTPIKLKLLEIYAARKDAKSFEAIATQLKNEGDDKVWQQVVAMGRKFDPKNALYGGGANVEDSVSATMQTVALAAPPDMAPPKTLTRNSDFMVAEPAAPEVEKTMIFPASDFSTSKNPVMDFDVTGTNPSLTVPSGMDFDVTGTNSKAEVAAAKKETLPSLDDLIFDVTASNPSMPAAKADATGPAKAVDAGEFKLDFPVESGASNAATAGKPAELKLSDINLNLAGDKADTKTGADSAQWHEVATKLDLAKAYQEMGDSGGAREILGEVMNEGDAEQRAAAQEILKQLG